MVKRISLLGLAAALSGASPQLDVSSDGIEPPPNLTAAYVRPAVDHVVVYSSNRGYGGPGLDRITLWRHNNLIHEKLERAPTHENGAVTDAYSNLLSKASMEVHLGSPEARAGFTLWRRTAPVTRYAELKSEETRVIAGEKCRVSRFRPIAKDGVTYKGCVTADGIVLYSAALYRDGSPLSEKTALSVHRQPVSAAQVSPPGNLLNWRWWLARLGQAPPSPTGRPFNYDVKFGVSRTEDLPKKITRMRAAAGWEMTEDRAADGKLVSFMLAHSSGRLALSASSNTLSVQFNPAAKPAAPGAGTKPLKTPPQRILGEPCHGVDTTVGWFDYSRIECRTADGLPLQIAEDSWGMGTIRIATSVTRGRTSSAEMQPPPGLLSWTRWGWRERDRR
jgi:hypothetical protein